MTPRYRNPLKKALGRSPQTCYVLELGASKGTPYMECPKAWFTVPQLIEGKAKGFIIQDPDGTIFSRVKKQWKRVNRFGLTVNLTRPEYYWLDTGERAL